MLRFTVSHPTLLRLYVSSHLVPSLCQTSLSFPTMRAKSFLSSERLRYHRLLVSRGCTVVYLRRGDVYTSCVVFLPRSSYSRLFSTPRAAYRNIFHLS